MNAETPRALVINPWVTDIAAYDLWARPLGLLSLAGLLRARGWDVGLIDCMDRGYPSLRRDEGRDDGQGRGKYRAETIATPDCLEGAVKRFRRYGISLDAFDRDAADFGRPDLILVTTRMTYWYPGAQLAIARLRRLFPAVVIALGGVYTTLCPEHARAPGSADVIIQGEGENDLLQLANDVAGDRSDPTAIDLDNLDDLPPPAWDLSFSANAPAVMTSRGCPMNCSYCASSVLQPRHRRRDPGRVFDEIMRLHRDHVATDIAFYDDALLVDRHASIEPLLDALIDAGSPVRLHTPNGVHASMIDDDLAKRMHEARMTTLRLGLETTDPRRLEQLDRSIGVDAYLSAMASLRKAGFQREQLGAYLLAALPGQSESEVRDSVDTIIEAGGTPLIGEYSPIPQTPEFARAAQLSGLPIAEEPLLQNNSVFHRLAPWSRDDVVHRLRRYARNRMSELG